jgi:hypothetical protein
MRRRNPDVGGFLLGAAVGIGGTLAVQWAMNNAALGSSSSSETSSSSSTMAGLPRRFGGPVAVLPPIAVKI